MIFQVNLPDGVYAIFEYTPGDMSLEATTVLRMVNDDGSCDCVVELPVMALVSFVDNLRGVLGHG